MNKYKSLISYMPRENSVDEFNRLKKEYDELDVFGFETIMGDYCSKSIYESLPFRGVHIIYFPTWLDIYLGNTNTLLEDFGKLNPYSIESKEELIHIFVKEFQRAIDIDAEYMVFHVSHVRPRDIFTFNFKYSDCEVMKATADLVNEILKRCNFKNKPYLLFENLPWPGLTFKSKSESENFLSNIEYDKCGFMLDLSHLMCLNTEIKDYDEGADYIIEKINSLGSLKDKIYGVHLNGSIGKKYLSQEFSSQLKNWEENPSDRYKIEISHVKSIDTHSIFSSYKIRDIINILPLKFLVYELAYTSLDELLFRCRVQKSFIESI